MENIMYQVSTLQALILGYSRTVINVGELIQKGDTGLGTFEDVNGEMIVMDGQCYRSDKNGNVTMVDPKTVNLPKEPAFDTYSLKEDLEDEIKSVE